jgi:hypothetical protein
MRRRRGYGRLVRERIRMPIGRVGSPNAPARSRRPGARRGVNITPIGRPTSSRRAGTPTTLVPSCECGSRALPGRHPWCRSSRFRRSAPAAAEVEPLRATAVRRAAARTPGQHPTSALPRSPSAWSAGSLADACLASRASRRARAIPTAAAATPSAGRVTASPSRARSTPTGPSIDIDDFACSGPSGTRVCTLKGCASDSDCHGGFCVNRTCSSQQGFCATSAV